MEYITSANIACGFHAGDPLIMQKTVRLAMERGVAVGAHPGFPDLLGFGRRDMAVSPQEASAYITYQVGALAAFVQSAGGRLQHVKPHGALYNMAAKDPVLAKAIAGAVAAMDRELVLVALAGSALYHAGREAGLKVAGEVFADRAYTADGNLVPRSNPQALIKDPVEGARRVRRMVVEGVLTALTGEELPVQADTVCVHGDTPDAVAYVADIRRLLLQEGITIAPMANIVGKAGE